MRFVPTTMPVAESDRIGEDCRQTGTNPPERIVIVPEKCFPHSSRITHKPEVKPAQPREPPSRRTFEPPMPSATPAEIRRAPLIHDCSFPRELAFRFTVDPPPSSPAQRRDGAHRLRRLSASTLVSFCNQLQFRSAASSCQPRLALYSLNARAPSLHLTLNQHTCLLLLERKCARGGRTAASEFGCTGPKSRG